MKWFFVVTLLSTSFVSAKPANDWSKPCFHGECAYDMPPSSGNSGVLRMTGAGITDITPAAGWIILDCDPHAFEQEIRLVCTSTDHEETGCSHVFTNGGAQHKVVRLPESCSDAPFLRIADAKIAEDQSIPHHAVGKITKRDGALPIVHILRVDGNWASSDVSKIGTVNFAFVGTNHPDVDTTAKTTAPRVTARAVQIQRREGDGFFDWIKTAFETVKQAVVKAANTVATAVASTAQNVVSTLRNLTSFSINPELIKEVHLDTAGHDITVYKLDKKHQPNCHTSVAASLEIVAGGKVDAKVKLGLTANGSVIPPQIGSYAVYAIVDGDVDAHVRVDATVTGRLSTERIEVAQINITPIQIPLIISLGPFIKLEAQADLDLSLVVLIDVHLKYKVDQLEFWYPKKLSEEDKDAKDQAKSIRTSESPFEIEAAANVAADANITAHLIPSLHLGLTALKNLVNASGYIEVDVWARVSLHGEVSAVTSNHHRELDVPNLDRRRIGYVPPYLGARGQQNSDTTTIDFKGCIGAYAGVVIRAGAQGSLGSLKAETPQWEIFKSQELEIISHCWGQPSKRSFSPPQYTSLVRRSSTPSLQCGQGTRSKLSTAKTKATALAG